MADIKKEIDNFKKAIYGEDVRGSMVSLAEKVNTEVEKSTADVAATEKRVLSVAGQAEAAVNTANATAAEITRVADTRIDEIETARDGAVELITQQAESTAKYDDIHRIALTGSAEGSYISVDDAADWRLANLELDGKSEQVQTTGKNIIDLSKCTYLKCSNNNGVITSNITNATYAGISCTDVQLISEILLRKGQNIAFSIDKIIANRLISVVIYGSRTSGATYQQFASLVGARQVVGVIANDFTKINSIELRFNDSGGAVFTDVNTTIKDIQLEFGTEATPFEPYTGGLPAPSPDYPQEIKSVANPAVTACGKNLFDMESIAAYLKSIHANYATKQADGSYLISVSSGVIKLPIIVEKGKRYTISADMKNKKTGAWCAGIRVKYTDGSLQDLIPNYANTERTHVKITTFEGKDIESFGISAANGMEYGSYFWDVIMVEGAEDTGYTPYTGNTSTLTDITLRSLPDGTADRLCKRDGVWGVERHIKRLTCTGDESWVFWFESKKAYGMLYLAVLDAYNKSQLFSNVAYFSHFKYVLASSAAFNCGYIGGVGDLSKPNIKIFFDPSKYGDRATDAQALAIEKAWMKGEYDAGNPLTVDYRLATPTWEPLLDIHQVALNKLESRAGQTNIFTDNPLQPQLKAEYIKDINKALSDITNAVISLGGNI